MKWYKELYVGEKAQENIDGIVSKIKDGKLQLNKYVLALPVNGVDVLDIYPATILMQKRYMESDIMVIGVAEGLEEAKELMQSIIMECYNITGDFNLNRYFQDKE